MLSLGSSRFNQSLFVNLSSLDLREREREREKEREKERERDSPADVKQQVGASHSGVTFGQLMNLPVIKHVLEREQRSRLLTNGGWLFTQGQPAKRFAVGGETGRR